MRVATWSVNCLVVLAKSPLVFDCCLGVVPKSIRGLLPHLHNTIHKLIIERCGTHDHNLYALDYRNYCCIFKIPCGGSVFGSPAVDEVGWHDSESIVGNHPSFTKKKADLFFPPDVADDFPYAMQISPTV
nr:putative acyl-activating enzyme 19 isoform X2 [Ipomoea trifida]